MNLNRNDWLGGVLGTVAALIVTLPLTMTVLLGLQVLDVITGAIAAGRSASLRSRIGRAGLDRKAQTWLWILAVVLMQAILPATAWPQIGQVTLSPAEAIAGLYAGFEFVSVAENVARTGVNLGPFRRLLGDLRPPADDETRARQA